MVDLLGKAGHMRTIPMPDWIKNDPRPFGSKTRDLETERYSIRGKLFDTEEGGVKT
jgi:hypothetical protein